MRYVVERFIDFCCEENCKEAVIAFLLKNQEG